jgi:hypothetical protein
VGILEECNSIALGLLSTSKRNPLKYSKEDNIASNNNEYAVGSDGDNEPLAEGDDDNDVPIAENNNDEPLANNIDNK